MQGHEHKGALLQWSFFLENKSKIGKVEEIWAAFELFFTVKTDPGVRQTRSRGR